MSDDTRDEDMRDIEQELDRLKEYVMKATKYYDTLGPNHKTVMATLGFLLVISSPTAKYQEINVACRGLTDLAKLEQRNKQFDQDDLEPAPRSGRSSRLS